ncbi:4Fe-4S binding protein [Pontibacter sp. BAB1700]|uniref:4Fe-4S binding protein n=1 Tax=Pontibacter sp. BAB1700 TaxID=1144253 RepID=UPI001ED97A14|nr:4Fe-4S binding protein [Pontibacter sp. BAB1700]
MAAQSPQRPVVPLRHFLYPGCADHGGIRLLKYRNSRYHIIRTISVMFFQLGFAFLLPGLLLMLNQPEYYFSYFWPLKYDYLFPSTMEYLVRDGAALGVFMIFWGAVFSFLATPVLTYFYGKRWYCSWVCGCGGLAETAGDLTGTSPTKAARPGAGKWRSSTRFWALSFSPRFSFGSIPGAKAVCSVICRAVLPKHTGSLSGPCFRAW